MADSFADSLTVMVEHAEHYSAVGLNGVAVKYGSKHVIDSAGVVDKALTTHAVGSGRAVPWAIRGPSTLHTLMEHTL